MTKREEESRRRLLRRWKVPECICNLEKPKDTILDVLLKSMFFLAMAGSIASSIFRYLFAIYAEKYYCIPSLYFYERKLDLGIVGIFVLIPAFIWFIPFFVKKVSKRSEFNFIERLLFSLAVALLVLIESLFFSMYFFNNENLFLFFSFGLSGFSLIGYCILFTLISRNNANEQNEGCNTTKNDKLMEVISGISYVSTAVIIFLMAFILIMKLSPWDPMYQRGYEFISGKESGYRIVVEHYKDSVVLMQGSDKEYKKNRYRLTINKGDYRVEPLGERQIEYRQFDEISIEDKNKK